MNTAETAKALAQVVKDYSAPLFDRIKKLEEALASVGELKDGLPGKDAEPVSVSEVADAVSAGFEKRFSDLTLSWERQARDAFEKAIDRMPKPKDGKDAAQISELDIVQDGRNVTIKLGDQERTIKIDSVIYREVWKEGEYEKGDAATYGGSLWIAKEDTNEVPGTSKAWQLAVKKGRDGKDLRDSASKHDSKKGVKAWG